tara:strand:+ start:197 stop:811 length:615 start_codon:yes stop_codon:yes gene_type:complete
MNELLEGHSMDPNVWGPQFWDLLFYISFHTNLKENVLDIHMLFGLLENILPCSQCRRHYAIYRKEVSPLTYIKREKEDSASKWLWTIHDMVNQNLGKICIDYDTVLKKHKSHTCIVSDFDILDATLFIWFSTTKKEKAVKGIRLIINLLKQIMPFKICDILQNKIDEKKTIHNWFDNKNELLKYYEYPLQTFEQFQHQYITALA